MIKFQNHTRPVLLAVLVTACLPTRASADLVLETETAELGKQGDGFISVAMQFERERDGSTGYFTVNQFEYGITDKAEILIESFFYE